MDERECLVKAQEAEAFANAALTARERQLWEEIAAAYRELAATVAQLRREGADPSAP